jgi:hypothetical protein
MHGFERQRFQNEHVQSALDEITRLVRHRRIATEDQEEEYASPTDSQVEGRRANEWMSGAGRLGQRTYNSAPFVVTADAAEQWGAT